jgi:hypothetical protein
MTEKPDRSIAYRAIRSGRKPFRGYPPERAQGKAARRTMLRVFAAKADFSTDLGKVCMKLIPALRTLIASDGGWIWKRMRFAAMLDRYAAAAVNVKAAS